MSVGRSVQYTKKDQVLNAYQSFEIPSWSIRNGNQLLWRYAGDDLAVGEEKLDRVLSDILDAKSIGIYTLCLYEKEPDEIRLKTEYDMSFNFRFQNESENYVSGLGGSPSLVIEEIRQMRKEIEELRNQIENDDDPPPPDTIERVSKLLENPHVAAIVGKILGGQSSPAQISGITGEEKKNQRTVALEILDSVDPDLTTHLVKLATLAQNNPKKFKALISTLDLM